MEIEEIEREIKSLDSQIDKAKTSVATNKGKITMANEQLEEMGLESVEDAKQDLKDIDDRVEKLDSLIEADFEEVKEDYEW